MKTIYLGARSGRVYASHQRKPNDVVPPPPIQLAAVAIPVLWRAIKPLKTPPPGKNCSELPRRLKSGHHRIATAVYIYAIHSYSSPLRARLALFVHICSLAFCLISLWVLQLLLRKHIFMQLAATGILHWWLTGNVEIKRNGIEAEMNRLELATAHNA